MCELLNVECMMKWRPSYREANYATDYIGIYVFTIPEILFTLVERGKLWNNNSNTEIQIRTKIVSEFGTIITFTSYQCWYNIGCAYMMYGIIFGVNVQLSSRLAATPSKALLHYPLQRYSSTVNAVIINIAPLYI